MKLLLTSGGITNDTLATELESLVGKPFSSMKIGFVPTAALCEPGSKGWLINDVHRLVERGAEVDVIDIAQLPKEEISARFEPVDVIFVGGGNTFYLAYHMEKSGQYDALTKLLENKVYAGISAGSMIMGKTLRIASHALKSEHFYDEEYKEYGPTGRSSIRTFGAINYAIRPHLNSRYFPEITEEKIQFVAQSTGLGIYALDDNCAVKVVNGDVSVVGEGEWHLIEPATAGHK